MVAFHVACKNEGQGWGTVEELPLLPEDGVGIHEEIFGTRPPYEPYMGETIQRTKFEKGKILMA